MVKRFSATGLAVAAADKTMLHIAGTSATRAALYDAWFSSVTAPADAAIRVLIQRITAIGSEDSAVIPAPLDLADAAAVCDVGQTHSSEPTYTSATEMFDNSFNQRATLRWVAVPGGELIIPATNNAGFGLKVLSVSSGTPQVECTIHFKE